MRWNVLEATYKFSHKERARDHFGTLYDVFHIWFEKVGEVEGSEGVAMARAKAFTHSPVLEPQE